MVGACDSYKMSHAIIENPMTYINNQIHVVYLKKPKKVSV
jgi:hypothetical protein